MLDKSKLNRIYNIDCLKGMKALPDECIDLTVTSPPYDEIRDYKGYSFSFENIAKELYRITKNGGVVVWIVGDATIKMSESGTSFKQALYFKEVGFNLHDTMIYEKNGASFPASAKSVRYSQVFEYVFVLSKGRPKAINLIKDRKNRWAGHKTFGVHSSRRQNGKLVKDKQYIVAEFGYRNNIWRINNGYGYSTKDKIAYNHPAIFPEALVEGHIITWSNEEDTIFDPFMGSGTTAKVAKKLNRYYLGFEISSGYVSIARNRLKLIED